MSSAYANPTPPQGTIHRLRPCATMYVVTIVNFESLPCRNGMADTESPRLRLCHDFTTRTSPMTCLKSLAYLVGNTLICFVKVLDSLAENNYSVIRTLASLFVEPCPSIFASCFNVCLSVRQIMTPGPTTKRRRRESGSGRKTMTLIRKWLREEKFDSVIFVIFQ